MSQKVNLGKLFLFIGFSLLALLFSYQAFSNEISIVQVRRNIPLADEAPVYKDFYLNAGVEAGLKEDMMIQVNRTIIVRDATGTQDLGNLVVPVGQLKIISAQNKVAVAREVKLISRDSEPMLDQIGIMVGDKVELVSSRVDKK